MAGYNFDELLGQKLMQLRGKMGWSQEELRVKIDIKRRETIMQWESGTRKIKAEHLVRLCKVFGVSADYLLELSDDPHRTPSAVDELGLHPDAVETIQGFKHRADGEADPNGDMHKMHKVLNRFITFSNFNNFLAMFVLAQKAAEKTKTANKQFIEQERRKGTNQPIIPASFEDKDSYAYQKFLCLRKFEEMLDSFCEYDKIAELERELEMRRKRKFVECSKEG